MPGMVTSVLEMIATTIEERKINLYLNWIQVFFFSIQVQNQYFSALSTKCTCKGGKPD